MHLHINTKSTIHCDLICTNITQVNTKHRKQNQSHFRQIPYHLKSSLLCATAAGLQFTEVILKVGTCYCGMYPRRHAAAEEQGVKQEDVNRRQRAANMSYVKTT